MRLYRHAKDGAQELVADFDNGIFNAQVADRGVGREVIHGGFGVEVDRHGVSWLLESEVYRLVL